MKNPFFLMAPDWALMPLVALATMATVIASQALITGAFSVTKQVIQLGYLPRLQIQHTSVKDTGQIDPPLRELGTFRIYRACRRDVQVVEQSGGGLRYRCLHRHADYYGTTFYVIRYSWNYPLPLCIAATGFFFLVDFAFWASNLLKLFEGLVPAGDWWRHLYPDDHLERRATLAQRQAARRRDRFSKTKN